MAFIGKNFDTSSGVMAVMAYDWSAASDSVQGISLLEGDEDGGRSEKIDESQLISTNSVERPLLDESVVTSSLHYRRFQPVVKKRGFLSFGSKSNKNKNLDRHPLLSFDDARDEVEVHDDRRHGVEDKDSEERNCRGALNKTPMEIMHANILAASSSQKLTEDRQGIAVYDLSTIDNPTNTCHEYEKTSHGRVIDEIPLLKKDTKKPSRVERKNIVSFPQHQHKTRKVPLEKITKNSKTTIKSDNILPFVKFSESQESPSTFPDDNKTTKRTKRRPTYPRHRVTPATISLSDLRSRLNAKSNLYEELDQILQGNEGAPMTSPATESVDEPAPAHIVDAASPEHPIMQDPVTTLRPPIGLALTPFNEEDDEDSDIETVVSSSIQIDVSSTVPYLPGDRKSKYLLRPPLNDPDNEAIVDDDKSACHSSMFGDLESQPSLGSRNAVLVESPLKVLAETPNPQPNDIDTNVSSTIFGGIADEDETRQTTTVFGGIETGETEDNQASTLFGDIDKQSKVSLLDQKAPIISVAALKEEHPLLAARSESSEGDWVSFGDFHHPDGDIVRPPTPPTTHKVEESTKVVLDISAANVDIANSLVQMNSGDISELTDYDFPDVSKASHPIDPSTKERLTTADIIRHHKERQLAKAKAREQRRQKLKEANPLPSPAPVEGMKERLAPPPPPASSPTKGDSHLLQRPTSTPFQNKTDGGTSPSTPPSALRRSSFGTGNQNTSVAAANTPNGSRTSDESVSTENRKVLHHEAKEEEFADPTATSMTSNGDTDYDEEGEDADPLSKLQCLTRISI